MIERFFIEQSMKKIELENYVKEQLEAAGFTHLAIVKTPLVTRIVLNVVRPGLAIGKEGKTINQLTREIGKRFGIENPQIEIQEIKNPELNAQANVDKMISLLERGYSWRSVVFRTMTGIMRAGAQGAELILSGKLAGKGGRKRKQRIIQGYMKKVGDQTKLVDFAKATAYPKPGAIGIKLRIIHPGVLFPDKIDIREGIAKEKAKNQPEEKKELPVEEKKEIAETKEKTEEKEQSAEAAKPVSKTAKKRTTKKQKEEKKTSEEKAEEKKTEKELNAEKEISKKEKEEKHHKTKEKTTEKKEEKEKHSKIKEKKTEEK